MKLISTKQYEHTYIVISIIFKKDNKWRLFDGSAEIDASIKDERFLNDIENGLSFSKGDKIRCLVQITQYETKNGLKTEYEILEVKR